MTPLIYLRLSQNSETNAFYMELFCLVVTANFSSIFSNNSEAYAAELLENREEKFPRRNICALSVAKGLNLQPFAARNL